MLLEKKESKCTGAASVRDVHVVKSSSGMKRHAFRNRERKTKLRSPPAKKRRGPFKNKINFDPRINEDQVDMPHDELKTEEKFE